MTHLVLRFLLAVAAPAVLLQLATAHAQSAPPDKAKLKAAKSYTDAGLAAQDAGDHDTAITFYSKAYELVPHPVLLFNIAQAHRLAGRADQAAELYRKFLATTPPGPEARLARELLAEIARREAEEARRAEAARKAREADEARKAREAEEARKKDREAPPRPDVGPTEAPRPERSPWYRDTIGGVLVLGGVASLALGGLAYRAALSDLETAETVASHDTAADLVEGAHGKRRIAIVLAGAGIALVGAGVLRFALRGHSETGRVALTPTSSGGLLTLTRSF